MNDFIFDDMDLFHMSAEHLSHQSSEDLPSTKVVASKILTFEEPRPLSIRASALVFEDAASKSLLSQIERVAPSDVTVLITGETGTGKELVARHIHALSERNQEVFGAINCAALSETLIESELFGHEKGSFTGALSSRDGWFQTAHQGTLFLDEVGDLPLAMQAKLLRVLQEREIVKVGARKPTPVDIRLIVATNVNLEEAVDAGHFRSDLYYRVNVINIHLLPLRERVGDILPLARHFLSIYSKRLGYSVPRISAKVEQLLLDYSWPGNIRELENAVHRALLVCPADELRPEDFKLTPMKGPSNNYMEKASSSSLEMVLQELFEKHPAKLYDLLDETVIRAAYEYCEENQVQTARLLDVSRNVLRHRLERYGMLTKHK